MHICITLSIRTSYFLLVVNLDCILLFITRYARKEQNYDNFTVIVLYNIHVNQYCPYRYLVNPKGLSCERLTRKRNHMLYDVNEMYFIPQGPSASLFCRERSCSETSI